MISVGGDVSKEKSTVCIMKPYGQVISNHFGPEPVVNKF